MLALFHLVQQSGQHKRGLGLGTRGVGGVDLCSLMFSVLREARTPGPFHVAPADSEQKQRNAIPLGSIHARALPCTHPRPESLARPEPRRSRYIFIL